jgi:hypothetical protein
MSRKKKKNPVKLDETLSQCAQLLKILQGKTEASPFLEPVDWEFYGLTDYPEIIKNPMDLGTIQVWFHVLSDFLSLVLTSDPSFCLPGKAGVREICRV